MTNRIDERLNNAPEVLPPEIVYFSNLKTIQGLTFTEREIDIIACVLQGRPVKRIAVLLVISPKTVATHLRNIMLKMGCNSQDKIIDFVEKSGKLSQVKTYYSSLLVKIAFESVLKKISISLQDQLCGCCIIYSEKDKDKLIVILQLAEHLKSIGVKTVLKTKEAEESLISGDDSEYIIYCLPEMFSKNQMLENTLFLLLDKSSVAFSEQFVSSKELIDLTEAQKYYFVFFEILKKLFPNVNFEKNIIAFEEYCVKLLAPNDSTLLNTKTLDLKEKSSLPNRFLRKKQWVALSILLITIFCFFTISGIYNRMQTITSKQIVWNLPRQDIKFVGRKITLEELHNQLSFNNKQASENLDLVVCAGLGGIGKTQLALQYAHHSPYPYHLKAWFSAENLDKLKQQYLGFAKTIGYVEETPTFEAASFYIKNWLKNHPGWLLIYDNVQAYEDISAFLPEKGGHVIITTRNRYWPNNLKIIPIDVMTETESIALVDSFLQHNKHHIETKENAMLKELAKTLGHLPLALSQAGAYLNQTQMPVAKYLELYKNHEEELLTNNNFFDSPNSSSVATTWNISLEAIKKETKEQAPLALGLLTVCGYLSPDTIPENLLITWIKVNYPNIQNPEWVLPKLISQLSKYSLINKNYENATISVHRLVQTIVRQQHKSVRDNKAFGYPFFTIEWYNTLIKSAHIEFVHKTQILEEEARQKDLLPHLQSLVNHFKVLWPDAAEFSLAPILSDLGTTFSLFGEPKAAQLYYERALNALEQHYNKAHPEIADTLVSLGNNYRKLGDIKQAKNSCERASFILEKNYGRHHFKTAEALECIGNIYQEIGSVEEAKDILQNVLKIKEMHYGKNHIELASTLELLGSVLRHLGNVEQSKALLEHALEIREQYFGKNHIKIAFTLNQLGRTLRDAVTTRDDLMPIKELYERAVEIQEKYYGKNHIEVAFTLDYLGRIHRVLRNLKEAQSLHERALIIKEKYYGSNHYKVASSLDCLGKVYNYLGDTKRAYTLHERALKIKEQHYGTDHLAVSYSLVCLGNDYRDLGEVEKAKALHQRALAILSQHYKDNQSSRKIGFNLMYLGMDYAEEGDFTQAKILYERALDIFLKRYKRNGIATTQVLVQLAKSYRRLGDAEQAKALLEEVLVVSEKHYDRDHSEIAILLNELGETYRDLRDLKKAEKLQKDALLVLEKHYGKDHPKIAPVLLNLGCTYRAAQNTKKARVQFERALRIRESYFGSNHQLTTSIKNSIDQL